MSWHVSCLLARLVLVLYSPSFCFSGVSDECRRDQEGDRREPGCDTGGAGYTENHWTCGRASRTWRSCQAKREAAEPEPEAESEGGASGPAAAAVVVVLAMAADGATQGGATATPVALQAVPAPRGGIVTI